MKTFTHLACIVACLTTSIFANAQEPIEIGFLWHMHQPTYRPGETIFETENSGVFSFSIVDVHNQRFGPYTSWPRDAIQSGLGLPNLGASVSFSGSLIRNLDDLENGGVNGGQWNNWQGPYVQAANFQTTLGNRRLDLVNFGFNHPLMPMLDQRDIEMQIRLQKHIHTQAFPGIPFSKGIFPPETAFSTRIIPALVAEGIEWAIADSIHIERATIGYPHTNASGIFKPNIADQINPDLASTGSQWLNLNGLWAPSAVAAPFAYRPHYAQYVDPDNGQITKMVVVPGARYEGNEDGRGGFGALQYEGVMSQYLHLNTDPNHPMFVLLHHDGDNFGGGSESYYHGNFNNMVNWLNSNSNYNVTTIQDYLDRFPVDVNDVIHIEDGSWAGADAGDPEFKKWMGDPFNGFSPDRNSWAVLTAARNRVFTADDISPATNLNNIIYGVGSSTERAWHTLLQAQGSDHWYWDGTEVWDSNVTLGSNAAVANADAVINSFGGTEATPPTILVPQREPYNPGDFEFGSAPEPSDFEVWTFAYDVSGLQSVTLRYRVDNDGVNPLDSIQNETFAGGSEVGPWISVNMSSSDQNPPAGILTPTYRALRYGAMVEGFENVLIDYYVEAVDGNGVVSKTDIQHVWVGDGTVGGGGDDRVVIMPDPAVASEPVTITYDPVGGPLSDASDVFVHYGINNWSEVYDDLPMNYQSQDAVWTITINVPANAETLDMVFNDGAGTWDNNNGQDWHFDVDGASGPAFEMDGVLDDSAELIATQGSQDLHFAFDEPLLYLATDDAGEGFDVFIYVAQSPGSLVPANWAKSGQIAQWDGYLADENDNGYHSWFDVTGQSATAANGGVLEGILDLNAVFGSMPSSIWVAVGLYETPDGGKLNSVLQLPGSLDGDGNIQAVEWYQVLLDGGYTPGDMNNDGSVDLLDVAPFVLGLSDPAEFESIYGYPPHLPGDLNGDGVFDLLDVSPFIDLLSG